MIDVLYIGGSPCSGKSTVAEALATKYGLTYFKVDDYLDDLIDRGAALGLPVCRRLRSMTAEETWMRDPQVQCREELAFYLEVAPLVEGMLHGLLPGRIVAEGAAFLPELMRLQGVPVSCYVAITPTREFQVSRYRERPWVPQVLQECSDPEVAFANWMARDTLFAEDVRRQCAQHGYTLLLTDGAVPEEVRLQEVARHFGLEK